MYLEDELLQQLWDLGKTPINLSVLKKYIESYDNESDRNLLIAGFAEGFRLQYTGPRLSLNKNKKISAKINKLETFDKLQREMELGRMLGPFNYLPISTLRISPIGLVEKSDHTLRLITHLSYPKENSVNDFIDEKVCAVKYSSFDQVLDMISGLGKSQELGKINIRQAFRLIIINPSYFDLLGIMFDDKYYVDKCLPM